MSSFVKAGLLGLGLMAGVSIAAQAQTAGSVSALPPDGVSTAGPSAVAPSGNYPGPSLGGGSNASSAPRMQGSMTASSGQLPGPAAGAGTGAMPPHFVKPSGYDADPAYAPYTKGLGPKTN